MVTMRRAVLLDIKLGHKINSCVISTLLFLALLGSSLVVKSGMG